MTDACLIHTLTSGPFGHNHAYPTCKTWSRDGKWVFVETNRFGQAEDPEERLAHLLAVNIETRESKTLATMKGTGGAYGFDYSPGGNCLVYNDPSAHDLYLLNLDTMKSGLLLHETEGTFGGPLVISHCGTRVAYWAMMPMTENCFFDSYITAIFAMDLDPVECKTVKGPWVVEAYPRRKHMTFGKGCTIHVNHCQINPTNKDHICYAHEMHGATPDGSPAMCRLWETMADGDSNRCLVRQPAELHFTHEVIAPDGKSLIFPYMHGIGQVWFDTLKARSIYYNPKCCPGHLTVSPDGKWIAGDTWGDPQSIMLMEVETRRYANLCWIPKSKGHPTHPHPNFSPDGKKIAFTHLVDGCPQVACINAGEAIARWDKVAEGVGEVASPYWRDQG